MGPDQDYSRDPRELRRYFGQSRYLFVGETVAVNNTFTLTLATLKPDKHQCLVLVACDSTIPVVTQKELEVNGWKDRSATEVEPGICETTTTTSSGNDLFVGTYRIRFRTVSDAAQLRIQSVVPLNLKRTSALAIDDRLTRPR